jgi:hypothetical protein
MWAGGAHVDAFEQRGCPDQWRLFCRVHKTQRKFTAHSNESDSGVDFFARNSLGRSILAVNSESVVGNSEVERRAQPSSCLNVIRPEAIHSDEGGDNRASLPFDAAAVRDLFVP